MTVITIVTIFTFAISIIWMWHNLGNIEKPRKIIFIIMGIFIMYLLTILIYKFSNPDVIYPSEEIQKTVSHTLQFLFTALNSLVLLPFTANLFDKILEEEIDKDQAKKRIMILLVLLILCIFIEKGYLKDTQEGIMSIYNEVQNAEK